MPVYNGEKYLKEAIQSVLDQTFKDFEFIIIDDGSTDESVKIAESFHDQRISLIRLSHGGIVKALNAGMKAAQGVYIIRADADDISLPERFKILLDYMENNKDVSICGSWADSINKKGEVVGGMEYPPVENKGIKKYLLLHNPFIHPSVIFRKKTISELGGYKNFKHNEDYELWTRVLQKNIGHNIPQKLIRYRVHPWQVTKNNLWKLRSVGVLVRLLALKRYFF